MAAAPPPPSDVVCGQDQGPGFRNDGEGRADLRALLECACGGLVPGSYVEGVNDTTHPLGVPKIVSS